jgi:hypothetical protein
MGFNPAFKGLMYIEYKRNIEALSPKQWYCAKAKRITYSDCLSVALVTQHTKVHPPLLLSAVICGLCGSSNLSYKRHNFRKVIAHRIVF